MREERMQREKMREGKGGRNETREEMVQKHTRGRGRGERQEEEREREREERARKRDVGK